MKEILSLLGLLFYQETPYYVIVISTNTKSKSSTYILHHKKRILCFHYLVPIDSCTTVGNKHIDKRIEWYKKYNQRLNNRDTIKEIEYFKNGNDT